MFAGSSLPVVGPSLVAAPLLLAAAAPKVRAFASYFMVLTQFYTKDGGMSSEEVKPRKKPKHNDTVFGGEPKAVSPEEDCASIQYATWLKHFESNKICITVGCKRYKPWQVPR